MRNPLPALAAFAKDAQAVSARSGDEDSSLGGWLVVTKTAERLSALRETEWEAYLQSLPPAVLPRVDVRPTLVHDDLPAPLDALGQLAERLRVEAERMERAGCLEMAFATVAAVCRLTSRADLVTRMLSAAHLGRVARQLGDLGTAGDCYAGVAREAARKRDGPLEALGLLGLGALARMRGNRPDERRLYKTALRRAHPGGRTERSAHQGLMNAAISEHRLADALLHGWRAFDLAPEGDEARAMILSNLAQTAFRADFVDAAVHGFRHVLTLTTVTRIRLPAYGGLLRALAAQTDREMMEQVEDEAMEESGRSNMVFEVASFLLSASEAWCALPDVDKASAFLEEVDAMVANTPFHELSIRAESLRGHLRASDARRSPLRESSWTAASPRGWEPEVTLGIHRLARL